MYFNYFFLLFNVLYRLVGGFIFVIRLERYAGPGKIEGMTFSLSLNVLYGI